jgi:hypothetical protein
MAHGEQSCAPFLFRKTHRRARRETFDRISLQAGTKRRISILAERLYGEQEKTINWASAHADGALKTVKIGNRPCNAQKYFLGLNKMTSHMGGHFI